MLRLGAFLDTAPAGPTLAYRGAIAPPLLPRHGHALVRTAPERTAPICRPTPTRGACAGLVHPRLCRQRDPPLPLMLLAAIPFHRHDPGGLLHAYPCARIAQAFRPSGTRFPSAVVAGAPGVRDASRKSVGASSRKRPGPGVMVPRPDKAKGMVCACWGADPAGADPG